MTTLGADERKHPMTDPLNLGDAPTRAQVADALQDGLLTPRQAGAYYPDMLTLAEGLGLDGDHTVELPPDEATQPATAAAEAPHVTDDVVGKPRLTAEQRDRATAALNVWYSDENGPAPLWRQPYSRYELRAMHTALEAPTLDEGFAELDGWMTRENARDQDRARLDDLRELLPYAGPDLPTHDTSDLAATDENPADAVAEADGRLVTDDPAGYPGEYSTADSEQVAWAQRERQRAAARGLQVTLEGTDRTDRTDRIDAAWDREGWHADHTDTHTAHLDVAIGSSDTDGLTA